MGYIRAPEIVLLLQHFDGLKELLKILKTQIELIKSDRGEESVYAAATNRNFDGMPSTGRIADRTAKIALNIPGVSEECREAIREIRKEINAVSMVMDKLELARRTLKPGDQKLISFKYEQGRTLPEIAIITRSNKASVMSKMKQALERMVDVCRIEQGECEKVLQIMKG